MMEHLRHELKSSINFGGAGFLGESDRQTIMQRVKRGELSVVHVSRGKQKGLRIRVLDNQPQLFDQTSAAKV